MLTAPSPPRSTSRTLAPYTGPWTAAEAGHLLRRATYAPLQEEIDRVTGLGLDAALDLLLAPAPPPPDPVYYDYDAHPDAGIGDSWVGLYTNPANRNQDTNARRRSMAAWWFQQAPGLNVTSRMAFFWHNHFGMDLGGDARSVFRDILNFRTAATGDFRQLLKDITVSVTMLRFLNGNQNTASNPNENFAREILELFTLGKGDQVGPGDYTNYTEQDVTELARAFTGWRIRRLNSSEPGVEAESFFQPNHHDTGTKQLSNRLGGAIIEDAGAEEYSRVIDLILEQEEVSRYLCRKLYRYFVYYEIDEGVEAEVIEPLAAIFRESNYAVAPVLRALFGSAHFYEATFNGALIRSPFEVILGVYRPLQYLEQQPTVADRYFAAHRAFTQARSMGLDLLMPPSVAGWPSYYQTPAYYRLWLNTATLQTRNNFYRIALRPAGFFWRNTRRPFDFIAYVQTFDDAVEPYAMIEQMAADFLPRPLAPAQRQALRDLLLPDLEDFVWSMEWADLLANPNDQQLRDSVDRRLRAMVKGLFELAEFQVY